jgi:hypothetical protein
LNPRKKWSRLTRMSADEVITRVRQEASKRIDLTLFRCGLYRPPSMPLLRDAANPEFFFGKDEVSGRVASLRRHLPSEVEAIIREADEICRHRLHLLGYDGLEYGPDIDFHLDVVHQKRTPLKPWFTVHYLDFSEVGDHKITWELNRHQHLVILAKAWCFAGERGYLNELMKQWYHWQKTNPYPLGINWASALEVAIRSLSWIWIRHLLAGNVAATFDADLLAALRQHGRYIERFHSKYFSPNTHLLGEAVALFYIGTLCPEIPEAQGWQRWGWDTVVREAGRQVRPDGVYFEQSLYYHVYALDFFLYARALAARNGIVIPEKLDNTLAQMLDFLCALFEAGPADGFGDDDGGRVFNPRRNRLEHMTDPLAIAAAEYQRCDWGNRAGLTEEAIWWFGEPAVSVCTGESIAPVSHSRAFESGGIHLIRDTEPFPQQMVIDAGPMGADTCGHGHADALSITFSIDGHRCLVDSGSYCYISAGDERSKFRGTAAHNTIRVDGLDQATSQGPFAWSSIPNVRRRQWLNGKTFNWFAADHDGYSRLADPVSHRRQIFHVKGAFWLVRDIVEGRQAHLLEAFWHLGPEFRVAAQNGRLTAAVASSETNGNRRDSRLSLLLARPAVWQMEHRTGEISPAYGLQREAPVVRVHATVQLPAECAVLLVPLAGESQAGQFDEIRDENRSQSVRIYRYVSDKHTHLIFCSGERTPWTYERWSSDAELFYCRIEQGRLTQMALLAGSFAKYRDKVLLSNPQPVDRFEWVYSQGRLRTFSSTPTLSEYARDDSLSVLDPVR